MPSYKKTGMYILQGIRFEMAVLIWTHDFYINFYIKINRHKYTQTHSYIYFLAVCWEGLEAMTPYSNEHILHPGPDF